MSKAMQIVGIVLGGIVAGVLTGGAAFIAAGGLLATATATTIAAATSTALLWGGVVGALTIAGGTLTTVSGWSGGMSGSAIGGGSPTYTWGKLQTQTSNCLAIPIIYGQCKVAGNTIWQDGGGTSTLQKIVALADGEIEAIEDVKINNKAIGSLSGCSYNGYIGTSTQLIDSRVSGANNIERANKVGGLRNTAYIALTAKASAELSGGVNLTTVVKGSKVKIYSNTQTPRIEYSNNPAWCILDFLTRYNGAGIPLEEIDIQSFIDAAEYCDQMVGEEGKKQKRFTLNLVLDEKKSRIDWLENMLIACRGYTFYQNGKLSLQIEKAANTMQVFDKDSILAGSEKFWTTPREKKIDIFKVQYIDPKNEYARIFAHAEAEEFQNEQPIVQEIQAWGVTNFNQASRLAWYYLNQAKTCDKFISFSTSQAGLDRTIGDVIEITSTFLGYENKKMRVVHMAEAQEGQIEIVCKEYNGALYSDKLGSANPVVNTITLPNAFDTPPTPGNLFVDENCWRTPEGNYVSTIKVSWDELDYFHLSHYEISYSDDGGITWSQGNISYDNNFVIENTKIDIEYIVKVQSVTHKNIFSDPAQSTILTIGKNNPPQKVKEFTVFQKGDMLKAVITPPNDPDIDHYEIRKGLFWSDSEFVCEFSGKETMFRPIEMGTVNYLIKAIDNVGNYSEAAVRASVNVSGLTPRNIIIEEDFAKVDFIDGGLINEEEVRLLPLINLGHNFGDSIDPKETFLTIDIGNVEKINVEYRIGYSIFKGWDELTFDEDIFDDTISNYDWEEFRNNPELYNLISWGEWKNVKFEPIFAGQYLQIRLYARCPRGEINDVKTVKVIADVEDIEDYLFNVELEAKKTTLTLNKRFVLPPTIIPITADSTGKTCAWRISNIQPHYFDIELFDKDDKLITGKLIQAVARGW